MPVIPSDPATATTLVGFTLGGVALGTGSELVPGLHANDMALLLAGIATAVPGPPRLVAAAMLAAGVVHTFLDVVPMLALGVPDPTMAAGAFPGHRLVLQGRGREALRLSAPGLGLVALFAVPLAAPVTRLMTWLTPHLEAHLPVVFAGTTALLVLTESDPVAMLAGGGSVCASAALGLVPPRFGARRVHLMRARRAHRARAVSTDSQLRGSPSGRSSRA